MEDPRLHSNRSFPFQLASFHYLLITWKAGLTFRILTDRNNSERLSSISNGLDRNAACKRNLRSGPVLEPAASVHDRENAAFLCLEQGDQRSPSFQKHETEVIVGHFKFSYRIPETSPLWTLFVTIKTFHYLRLWISYVVLVNDLGQDTRQAVASQPAR